MKRKVAVAILFMLVLCVACSDFVENVDPLIDKIEDDQLNDESQLDFLINGVMANFAVSHGDIILLADGLSDQIFFNTNIPGAILPKFFQIEHGTIQFDNSDVTVVFRVAGELRFQADDLLRRLNEIEVTDPELARKTRHNGYLFGGIARYLYATYFGLNPAEGGGVEENSRFIPSDEMYDRALDRFANALDHAGDEQERRMVSSLIARTYLYQGDAANALSFAQSGLAQGDPPFRALYDNRISNSFFHQAGRGLMQWAAANRFSDYILADSSDAARIQIEETTGRDGTTIFWRQFKYATEDAPINVISWQENELMLAELELDSAPASALARINEVRASHGIGPLAVLDLTALIQEREKELFLEGARLVDQRRFGLWHLGAGTWQYLPFSAEERNNNPCLTDPSSGDCEPPPLR